MTEGRDFELSIKPGPSGVDAGTDHEESVPIGGARFDQVSGRARSRARRLPRAFL